ncbi:MAG: phage portal protein [Burkholderiaceae bacterium]|nr:MAG: phage portal protein [Burkholderiaceae bacterium]
MPLPTGRVEWPPPAVRPALKAYDTWGAWYSGDPDALGRVYAATAATAMPGLDLKPTPAGGVFTSMRQAAARWFWGSSPLSNTVRQHKLHVPLAADIAQTSADLLFGEPPQFSFSDDTAAGDDPLVQQLGDIIDGSGAHSVWLEAAELAAAYGGAYLRVGWDPTIADHPLQDVIPPDAAVPEFRGGVLTAVTFWRDLDRPDSRHWRHLERHEPGRVLHGLYASTDEALLGQRLPLEEHDATAPFAMLVDARDKESVVTGATGLAVQYLPNMRPNRGALRGQPIGRSDYAGVEPILDALDEAWTSWMRDLRLGKGRLVVPRSYLQSMGRGGGALFDPEREVYESVDALTAPDANSLAIHNVQFQIRVDEHQRTTAALLGQAVRGCGYSVQSFGEADRVTSGHGAATATEVVSRDQASTRTRGRKIGYARQPMARNALTLLQVNAYWFKGKEPPKVPPRAIWPDRVAPDPETQARTLQLLLAAEAASTRTRVRILNPDWSDADIDREVIEIKAEVGAAHVPQPGQTLPGDPNADPFGNNNPADGQQPAAVSNGGA